MSSVFGSKPERPSKPKLKKRTIEHGAPGKPGLPDTSSPFKITRPVSYEERILLQWANTDESVRKLFEKAWISPTSDPSLVRRVEAMIDWNIDSLAAYHDEYEDSGKDFTELLAKIQKEMDAMKRIRKKHRLAERLMDQLELELQRERRVITGFPDDVDLMAYADSDY